MVSRQFKQLVKGIEKTGWAAWDIPHYVTIDKVALEPKPTAKNMTAYELVQLAADLPEKERELYHWKHRDTDDPLKPAMKSYAESQLGKEAYAVGKIIDLYRDYKSKMKELEAKKARADKKREKELAKQKLIQSLDRKDIARTITKTKKSMEPYIRRQEKSIQSAFKKKEKELMGEWKKIYKDLQKQGIVTDRSYSGRERGPESLLMYGKVYDDAGKPMPIKGYVQQNHYRFMSKWFDRKGYAPKPSAKFILNGQTDDLIQRAQKQFRDNEELKVEILFHRLLKNNPTLRNYQLAVPYNGSEFTLSAENEKGEEILIQTNTIEAGGYNIQRLHTRWLVDIRNTVTNKKEKFTIDDKDTKK